MKQERKKYQSLAFSKHTPTAFIVESPFQLLCAWNAIADFEIEDYRIVLVLERSNIRNQQVFDMLQSRDMSYDVCYGLADIIKGRRSKRDVLFDRVMIGEILYKHHLAIAGLYASADSVVVYMDDGAASIRVLTGHSFNESRFKAFVKKIVKHKANNMLSGIKQYWITNGIHDYGFYYTIYSDIPARKFITYPNMLNKLQQSKTSTSEEKAILIIGAATNDYAAVANISVPEYEGILWRKMREVRYAHPNARIIYIPHGRDNNKAIERFCEILDMEYRRLSMTIEQYVLDADIIFTHITLHKLKNIVS